jgi:ribosomal protein RSM22 (predicted rRNA methylase)
LDLPAERREQIEELFVGVSRSELAETASALSTRYRRQLDEPRRRPLTSSELDVLAYVAARLPATFAAVASVLRELQVRIPDFEPRSMLDVGAGPGTASWAAHEVWPDLVESTLLERDPRFVEVGERLAPASSDGSRAWSWHQVDVGAPDASWDSWPGSDLVVVSYLTTELSAVSAERVVDRAWDATVGALVVVEPGTPAGFRRILEVRELLLALGATVVAPCPHEGPCPLAGPEDDWCHFSQRLARSRLHREVKRATAPFEEERYCYLAVSRSSDDRRVDRVLAPPKVSKGSVVLDLCRADGRERRTVSRSDRPAYSAARKLRWGSGLEPSA